MKTAGQILGMTKGQLRNLVAKQQVDLAHHDQSWAGSQGPEEHVATEEALAEAKSIQTKVQRKVGQDNRAREAKLKPIQ